MRSLVACAVSAAVLLAVTSTAAASTRVVGGHDAPAHTYDAVANIHFSTFACSGTLVSPQWVLSAGHCASMTGELFGSPVTWPASSYTVTLGTTKTDGSGGHTYQVDDVRTPPGYLLTDSYDASLLHLTSAATESPVKVAGAGAESLWTPGTLETIAGFGTTSSGGSIPATMQVAQVPIVSDADCAKAYPDDSSAPTYPTVFESKTMLCAGYPQGGIDTCNGDSGGPLFGHDADGALKIVGSTSQGQGCAQAGYPGIYARVAGPVLRDWIRSVVGDAIDDHVRLTPSAPAPAAPTPVAPVTTTTTTTTTPAPSAPGAPAPEQASGGTPPAALFAADVALARTLRGTLAKRGLRVGVSCSAACTVALTLRVDRQSAQRLHLASRDLGRATLSHRAGRFLLHVRLRSGGGAVARDPAAHFTLLGRFVARTDGQVVDTSDAVPLH